MIGLSASSIGKCLGRLACPPLPGRAAFHMCASTCMRAGASACASRAPARDSNGMSAQLLCHPYLLCFSFRF